MGVAPILGSRFGRATLLQAQRVMMVLLRDLDSGLFFRAGGGWVKSALEATDFKEPEHVEAAAKSLGKGNLEVFVTDEQGRPRWGRRIELEKSG